MRGKGVRISDPPAHHGAVTSDRGGQGGIKLATEHLDLGSSVGESACITNHPVSLDVEPVAAWAVVLNPAATSFINGLSTEKIIPGEAQVEDVSAFGGCEDN